MSILLKAENLVNGARQEMYADPIINFARISNIASAITGKMLSPVDCCNVMIAVKLAREIHKHTTDNLVDCAGYIEILDRIKESNAK